MSHLTYGGYEPIHSMMKERYGYSQAVRIGDRIECSGQGGYDPVTLSFEKTKEINVQIDQTFANIAANLKAAGGAGWDQVFRVNSYHVPLNDEALEAMARNFKKWMPNYKPIWTAVGVARLGLDDMRVEIEVVAHIPADKPHA